MARLQLKLPCLGLFLPIRSYWKDLEVWKTAQNIKPGDLFLRLAWQNVSISACPSSTCLDLKPDMSATASKSCGQKADKILSSKQSTQNHVERTGDKGMQKPHSKTSTLSLPNCSTTCIEMLLLCSRRTHKRREDVERPITNCRRSSLFFRFRWYS